MSAGYTAFAGPFFIVASSSAAGHPIKRSSRLGNAVQRIDDACAKLSVELLLFLSIGESCWYTINGGADEYILARRRTWIL